MLNLYMKKTRCYSNYNKLQSFIKRCIKRMNLLTDHNKILLININWWFGHYDHEFKTNNLYNVVK